MFILGKVAGLCFAGILVTYLISIVVTLAIVCSTTGGGVEFRHNVPFGSLRSDRG
jgi:hypothetical protein